MIRNYILFAIIVSINLGAQSQTTVNFNYTGSSQTWVVPPCVTSINVIAQGAKGGGANGGNGAIVTATLSVNPGDVLQINVGGMGNCGSNSSGWNGGGSGQAANSAANGSCGGGGATDIRITPYGLGNRLIVAAGGGGMGGGTQDAIGGTGGCPNGQAGTSPFGQGGGGATTSSGGVGGPPWISSGNSGQAGTLGVGGVGATDPCYNNSPGGGGGGGLYGGGGGGSDCFSSAPYGGGSGGGGSSLVPSGGTCTSGASGNTTHGSLSITYTIGTGTATPTNTGPYCVGQTIQLNSAAAASYSWTGPNGFSSALQNPVIPNSTAANAGSYTLTTIQDGCESTGFTTVVVNPLPNVNAGSDVSVCQNGSTTLTASGATSYSWSPGGQTTASILVSPASTTTYTVSGTTSGCVNTDQVVVTVNPLPNVSTGPDVSICSSGSTTLTASGATSYTWSPGGQTTTSIIVSPATTTTYTVTGTELGCTNSANVTVTVLTTIPIDAGSDVEICQGASTILLANGGETYSWNNGLGVGNGFSVSPSITTTYSVTGTDVNGCTGTDEVIVTVNSLPDVYAGADQAVCEGVSITLSGSGAQNYTWSNSVSNGVPFNQPVGSVVYSLTGTDSNGCVNTDDVLILVYSNPTVSAGSYAPVCSDSPAISLVGTPPGGTFSGIGVSGNNFDPFVGTQQITYNYSDGNGCSGSESTIITVNALPIVSAGIDQSVCAGSSVTLNGSGALNYSWTGSISDGVAFVAQSSSTYTVTGTDANGCVNSDQMQLTVFNLPQVDAGMDQTVCAGAFVTLSASGASSYSWTGGVQDNIAFVPGSSSTYTVTGTDVNGCVGTDQVVITVNNLPTIYAGNDITICDGSSIVLSGAGGLNYSWSNGVNDGVSFVPPLGSTSYTVTGTDANGCVNVDEVIVTVVSYPIAYAEANEQSGNPGLEVELSNFSTGATSFTWIFGNGQSATTSNNAVQTMVYSNPGTYIVQLIADNGYCTDTDTVHIFIYSLPDPTIHIPNVFSPNGDGVNDQWTIQTTNTASMSIVILNRWGNKVAEITGLDEVWDGTSNGKEVSDGVYFFQYRIIGLNDSELTGHGSVTVTR